MNLVSKVPEVTNRIFDSFSRIEAHGLSFPQNLGLHGYFRRLLLFFLFFQNMQKLEKFLKN